MKYPQIVASLITGSIGFIFIMIGESTPQWAKDDYRTAGLFVVCGSGGCASYSAEGAILGAKALVVIAFLASLAGLIVLIVYYTRHIRKDTTNQRLSAVSAGLFIGGAASALIGAIIFAASGKSEVEAAFGNQVDLGYSFALTIVGSITTGVAGGLALMHRLGLQN